MDPSFSKIATTLAGFQSCGILAVCQMSLIKASSVTNELRSYDFKSSVGMWSGPAAFESFSWYIACMDSSMVKRVRGRLAGVKSGGLGVAV